MKKSISQILMSRIALVVICVNVFVSTLFFLFSVQLAQREFQKSLDLQSKHLADAFTQQLWLFDMNTTEHLASMAADSPEISGLRLLDHTGRIKVEKGVVDPTKTDLRRIELVHKNGVTVGSLELFFTHNAWEHQRGLIMQVSLIIVFLTVLLTFVLVRGVIRRYLTTPLKNLQQDMDLVAEGRFQHSDLTAQSKEIQTIVDGFNRMAAALAQRESERERAEQQQKKLESELRQKYKMEAVGLMAGGIAHNFNNNLAIILGNIELAKLKFRGDSAILTHFDDAITAVQRSRDLTKQILSYSRQDNHELVTVKLSLIVEETLKLLRSTVPSTVALNYRPQPTAEDAMVKADSTRIQEALINLCNNAVQAMDESGELAIGLKITALQQDDIPVRYSCAPGSYVCLEVKDTGCGMTAEIIEKIFDPFFTTKEVDKGTGMGLSTVQGIVEQHNGLIKVQSQPDNGTMFELFLPLAGEPESFQEQAEEVEPLVGTEKILFLDDEKMLAQLGGELLTSLGYQVETMTDSLEALDVLKKNPDRFDLLVTDQTMPKLTGLELVAEIRRFKPELPVILCTGYSSKVPEGHADELDVAGFCMKPLERASLAELVRKVLDQN